MVWIDDNLIESIVAILRQEERHLGCDRSNEVSNLIVIDQLRYVKVAKLYISGVDEIKHAPLEPLSLLRGEFIVIENDRLQSRTKGPQKSWKKIEK